MNDSADHGDPFSENGKQGDGQIRWDDARIFLAIARAGTLSGAAAQLGLGLATVSRRIERLELGLGIPLFSRHQSGYRLTDEGEALLVRAEALEQAGFAFAERGRHAAVSGKVRLATAENLANPFIIPALPPLLARHPALSLEVLTDVSTVNLHRRDADLAVRMVEPQRGHVVLRRLGQLGFGLYGAADYVAARGDSSGFEADQFIGWAEPYGHLPAAQWMERVLAGARLHAGNHNPFRPAFRCACRIGSCGAAALSGARGGAGLH